MSALTGFSLRPLCAKTKNQLFTIVPDLGYKFVQLVHHRDGLVHVGEEFDHVTLFEFLAFGVSPVIFGFIPPVRKFFRDCDQPVFASAQAHDGLPFPRAGLPVPVGSGPGGPAMSALFPGGVKPVALPGVATSAYASSAFTRSEEHTSE